MTPSHTFHNYFDLHIGTIFARQLQFSSQIKEHVNPQLDTTKGTIAFGAQSIYNIQLLGTQLEEEQTWLWAWSDHNTPPYAQTLLRDAQEIKALGHAHHIEQFAYDNIPLELSSTPLVPDEMNGDYIASIAAGLFNTVYWRVPLINAQDHATTLFFLIKNPDADLLGPFTVPEILNTIEEIAAYYETDDQVMVQSFLEQQGFTIHWDKNHLKAQRGTETVDATFGIEDHCIEEIEAHGFEGEDEYQDSANMDDDNWLEEEEEEFPPRLRL